MSALCSPRKAARPSSPTRPSRSLRCQGPWRMDSRPEQGSPTRGAAGFLASKYISLAPPRACLGSFCLPPREAAHSGKGNVKDGSLVSHGWSGIENMDLNGAACCDALSGSLSAGAFRSKGLSPILSSSREKGWRESGCPSGQAGMSSLPHRPGSCEEGSVRAHSTPTPSPFCGRAPVQPIASDSQGSIFFQ